ncbi:hypothetical protein BKA82DRAFT_4358147 [Pisolithus tinctorius]|nr:hypothetical protein BKA82DRAFT_4358147 [Pisolithus tinctorius]
MTNSSRSFNALDEDAKRKYVWVAECINAGRALLEDLYRQGATLLLHLSPFDAKPGVYDPNALLSEDESETSVHEEENEGIRARSEGKEVKDAELAAEVAGVEYDESQKGVKKLQAAPLALSPLGYGRVPLA